MNEKIFMLKLGIMGFIQCFGLFFWWQTAQANNLVVENVTLTDQDTAADTYDIEFDISWENSWYTSGAPSLAANWDAAWVFAKYSVYNSASDSWSDWTHAKLLNTGSVAASGARFTFADTGGVYVGAFIYRSAAGSGDVDWDDNQIRWDYGADGVSDNATVRVRVFAVEMVYIPQGQFYIGDTDCDNEGNFRFHSGCDGAIAINSALTEPLCTSDNSYDSGVECADEGDSVGTFCIDGDGGFDLNCDGIENANFPTGYNAFYIMKYELSQGQYVDFLNSLTRAQQNNRTISQTANQYVLNGSNNVLYRNGIRAPSTIPAGVITFGNDLDGITAHNTSAGDGIFNEIDDGQWVAANFLSWMDQAAYCDWSGLRPFTELEYEKAARGGQTAVDDEYAWGNTTLETNTTSLSDSGRISETPNQGNMNYYNTSPQGPYRVGAYADTGSSRTNSGGSYFGVMDLSGNLWEQTVTVGNTSGQAFAGTHGDGVLSSDGYATNSDWPGASGGKVTGANGAGFRGGGWRSGAGVCLISMRYLGASAETSGYYDFGARCARTAP